MRKLLAILLLLCATSSFAGRINVSGGGGVTLSTNTAGAESFIWNQSILQDGATFYVSSGTVEGELAIGQISTVDYIQYNMDFADGSNEGRQQWNEDEGTANLGLAGGIVNLQIGMENVMRARNDEGSNILNGELVRLSSGTGSQPVVEYSNASDAASGVTGFATEDIDNNQFGYVTTSGLVRGDPDNSQPIDTSAYGPATSLFLSSTDGQWVNTPPTNDDRKVFVGSVIRQHASEGVILANIINVSYLRELSGNQFTVETENDSLRFDGTVWRNVATSTTGALGYWDRTSSTVTTSNAGDNFIIGGESRFDGGIFDTNDVLAFDPDARKLYASNGTYMMFDYSVASLANFGNAVLRTGSLSPNLGIYMDAVSQMTSTPPSTGILGHWSRAGTTVSPSNAGDNILGAGTLEVSEGSDVLTKLGYAQIGFIGFAGYAGFRNKDTAASAYALLQDQGGRVFMNAASGQNINILSNNNIELQMQTNGDWDFQANAVYTGGTIRNDSDGGQHTFGLSNDADVHFDGDSMNFRANLVTSTDDMEFDADFFRFDTTSGAGDFEFYDNGVLGMKIAQPAGAGQSMAVEFSNGTKLLDQSGADNRYVIFAQGDTIHMFSEGGGPFLMKIRSDGIDLPNDSQELTLGAAEDVDIVFDGDSLNITANSVTSTDDMNLVADKVNIDPLTSATFGDGGVTDYVDISSEGVTTFAGSGGLPHASMYQDDTGTPITINAIGQDEVVSGYTVGQLNNFEFVSSSTMSAKIAGDYRTTWQVSFSMVAGINQEIEGTIGINGTRSLQCSAHRYVTTGSDTGSMSGTCILAISAGDKISVMVRNETSTNNISIEHTNFSTVLVGG